MQVVMNEILNDLRARAYRELREGILPFWIRHAIDHSGGGFFGEVERNGRPHKTAARGLVLNARILWTFSAVFRMTPDPVYREMADRALGYLLDHFVDRQFGGAYWLVDSSGAPLSTRKQVYGQAFFLYGLAEYGLATGDSVAEDMARAVFEVLEEHAVCEEPFGYLEAKSEAWETLEDLRLSDKDLNEPRSMNTHLHVLEAYTNLFRLWPEERLARRLEQLIELFLAKIIRPDGSAQTLFFSENWEPRSGVVSFGHDIEASWLLIEAAEVMARDELTERVVGASLRLAGCALESGLDDEYPGLHYERKEDGSLDSERHWWPQAEAAVGALCAYEWSQEPEFLQATQELWRFIENVLVDREHGEWFAQASREGVPLVEDTKIDAWKAPYHNSRACMEIISRCEYLLEASASSTEVS